MLPFETQEWLKENKEQFFETYAQTNEPVKEQTIEEAVFGVKKEVKIQHLETCDECTVHKVYQAIWSCCCQSVP